MKVEQELINQSSLFWYIWGEYYCFLNKSLAQKDENIPTQTCKACLVVHVSFGSASIYVWYMIVAVDIRIRIPWSSSILIFLQKGETTLSKSRGLAWASQFIFYHFPFLHLKPIYFLSLMTGEPMLRYSSPFGPILYSFQVSNEVINYSLWRDKA